MRRNRLAWLAALVAAAALWLFDNNTGTLAVLAALAVLPLFSGLALLLARPRPEAALTLPAALTRGAPAEGAVSAEGAGLLPVFSLRGTVTAENLMTGETARFPFSGPCGKKGFRLPFTLTPEHLGALSLTGEARLLDPLGLFSRPLPPLPVRVSEVRPETFPVSVSLADTADFLDDGETYSAQKPGYDPSETFRIREYRPGDPIRQIHWKLSEKTGKTLVRDLGLPVVSRMLVLWETDGVTPEAADRLLPALFSLSRGLLEAGVGHMLGFYDNRAGLWRDLAVEDPEGLEAAEAALLRAPLTRRGQAVPGAYLDHHLSCAYAHAALLAPRAPEDTELLCTGNRVTVLALGGEKPLEAGYEVALLPESIPEGGLSLVL